VIVTTLSLDRICVGERARREMRNIDSLARSIRERGLLQPVVVRPDGDNYALVAGGRRIEAHRALGFDEIPAHIAETLGDELEALYAEGEENTEREEFTPTEAVEHAGRIRSIEEQRAADRKRAGQRAGGPRAAAARAVDATAPALEFVEPASDVTLPGNLPGSVEAMTPAPTRAPEKRVRDQVAKATGMSGRTLEKARHVVEAARDPEAPGPVREAAREAQVAMDRTGKVDPAFKKVRAAEAALSVKPVHDHIEADGELQRLRWQAKFQGELALAFGLLGKFRPEQVAANADDALLVEMRRINTNLANYIQEIETLRARPAGLSLVVGG
jgi:ParB family chromosome partitioning protein